MNINFGHDHSKFKMILYLKSGEKKCYYSLLNEEERGDLFAISNMKRRLFVRYKLKLQTALIYHQKTGQLIEKHISSNIKTYLSSCKC